MKLLIADDEELTRDGLITSISWAELGITELYQAADGIQGLALARTHRPHILLSDVRMPRMDGIWMAKEIQQFLPDCEVIFMSGYSDKEYLKAAIRMKAVSYVEKPLQAEEIREAVLEALENCRMRERARLRDTHLLPENAARLALLLTVPYEKNRDSITRLWSLLKLPPVKGISFLTILVQFESADWNTTPRMLSLEPYLHTFLKSYLLSTLNSNRYEHYLVIHLYGSRKITNRDRDEILSGLRDFLTGSETFYITCGSCQDRLPLVYASYETSVFLMESCFFFEPGSILTPDDIPQGSRGLPEAAITPGLPDAFLAALLQKNQPKAEQALEQIYRFYYRNMSALSDPVKETYYRLFTGLEECRTRLKLLTGNGQEHTGKTVIRYLEEFFSLGSLHQALTERTRQFFHDTSRQTEESPTVYLTKCFIRARYMNENLSVKDISEHVHLTASYLCTMFKAETNQTLNQYLTEFRIEQAKHYLREPHYKITEIAPLVGYSDSNYFSKSFKKTVGISPSEYREKWMI